MKGRNDIINTVEKGITSANSDLTKSTKLELTVAENIIRKSYKFRIYPNKTVTARLEHTLEICREIYNAGLQERRDAWKMNRVNVSLYDQHLQLPAIRAIREDVGLVYAHILQFALRQVDAAFQSFFRRVKSGQKAGYPRFKAFTRFSSFTYPGAGKQGVYLNNDKLTLSKIGTVKIKLSRPIRGKIKTCTIQRECGKWYAVFSVESIAESLPKVGKAVGIDVGISSFATLSDGTQIANDKFFQSAQKKLRVAQRRVARRKKGSRRRKKAVLLLQKTHVKIRNSREDFQHKVSTDLIKRFDVICIEKLNVKGMSRGILSKQVHDVAWTNFFHKLAYKAESAGRKLIEVNPSYTSQDCSRCGFREKKVLSERVHNCKQCGLVLDRDHNAALNILALGQGVQALTYRDAESVA